tara:strand:+ start:1382 stop:1543 length:162 start_codon:yes stop_codon:yes gene_type:complete
MPIITQVRGERKDGTYYHEDDYKDIKRKALKAGILLGWIMGQAFNLLLQTIFN